MGKIVKGEASRNGAAGTPVDWAELKRAILARLDVAAEYEALGVRFSRPAANASGVRECHAVGRKDEVPSAFVNVRTGVYHDSGAGESLNFWDFALKHGRGFGRHVEVVRHYGEKAGVAVPTPHYHSGGRIREAEYDYEDESGAVLFRVFRYRLPTGKKSFSQHPPDGRGGWRFGAGAMDGVRLVPYRLPRLVGSAADGDPVYLVEGEKDADRLAGLGLVVTCNPMGAGKWRDEFARYFAGRDCYVLPDNDEAGRKHAAAVAASLRPVARSVKVVELPGLPPKGDVSDWLDQGGTVEELGRLAFAAPGWEPTADTAPEGTAPADVADEDAESWGEPVLDASVPAAPFPTEVFPAPLAALVIEGSDCLNCPPDYLGVACLAVASGAIGRSVALALKDGWIEAPSIFAAVVGDPGATKSPALALAARPLWSITNDLIRRHRLAAAQARKDKEEPPPLPRIAVDDTTVEALAPILRDNPRGLIMVRDELTAWVAGLNQYKNGKGADRQFFLSAWSGSPVVVDRKRNEGVPILIPRPFLSVVGALTPGMLTELSEERDRDDGFLDRLLFTLPDPVPVRWRPDGLRDGPVADWGCAVRSLWDRAMVAADDGHSRPFVTRFTAEGSRAFGAWFDAHCAETEHPDFPAHLRGPWAKFRAYCGRLALVVELIRGAFDPEAAGNPPPVGAMAVADAVVLVDYFKCHARRVRALLRGAGADNDDARAILDWCRHTGRRSFSERDARRNFHARFAADNRALARALDWLKVRRCVRAAEPGPTRPGRPGSPAYDVNPALFGDQDEGE